MLFSHFFFDLTKNDTRYMQRASPDVSVGQQYRVTFVVKLPMLQCDVTEASNANYGKVCFP